MPAELMKIVLEEIRTANSSAHPQPEPWAPILFLLFSFLKKYLFIWLYQVLVAAGGLLSCGLQTLSCSLQTLSCSIHVGSSSLTRDRTRPPALGGWNLNHCATREVPTLVLFDVGSELGSRKHRPLRSHFRLCLDTRHGKPGLL